MWTTDVGRATAPSAPYPKAAELNDFNFLMTEVDNVALLSENTSSATSISAASAAIVTAEFNYAKAQLDNEGRIWDMHLKSFKTAIQDKLLAVYSDA